MVEERRKLLIIDDSEIDREVLKSILGDEFETQEANNGYAGLEIILNGAEEPDAILLDVSMPVLDGFSVMRVLRDKGINNIPVFMITAEATKDNVEKARELNISEFIKKPFDREDILKRVRTKLGIVSRQEVEELDEEETRHYIDRLEQLYRKYLTNLGRDMDHYKRMTDLMLILLNSYVTSAKGARLRWSQVEMISKAAFFCDIGYMLLPGNFRQIQRDDCESEIYQAHTELGAELIRLNGDKGCAYFVEVCADMCMHHHERYDGAGYPDRLLGERNSVYTQMCRLVDEFDSRYFKYREHNEVQFDFVMSEMMKDEGAVKPELLSLFADCKANVMMSYNAKT